MKKLISIIIVLLALVSLTHCKLAEVEAIEEIPARRLARFDHYSAVGHGNRTGDISFYRKSSKYIRNGPF